MYLHSVARADLTGAGREAGGKKIASRPDRGATTAMAFVATGEIPALVGTLVLLLQRFGAILSNISC